MYKTTHFLLRGPICNCENKNLSWTIFLNKDSYPGLRITCQTCKVFIEIPNSEFKAHIILDVPYPGAKDKEDIKKAADILKLFPGGKDPPKDKN